MPPLDAGDLSNALSMSYGQPHLLDVVNYSVKSTPVIKEKIGQTGTTVVVTIEAELRGAGTQTDFSADVAATYATLSVPGQDLIISSLAGIPEFTLPAAVCRDGGPNVEIGMDGGSGPLWKMLKLTITGITAPDDPDNPNTPKDSFSVKITTTPDGLLRYERTGEIHGPNSTAYYLNTSLPSAKRSYPLPHWVLDQQYQTTNDENGLATSYTLTAQQLFGLLPAGSSSTSVAGDATLDISRDEQHRKTTTSDYDLLFTGNSDDLLKTIRPDASRVILREKVTLTTIKENRLKASFTVLESADSSPLMNFTQTFAIKAADTTYEIKSYVGADPIIVANNKTFPIITQSGSATCVGRFLKAPAPILPLLAAPPAPSYTTQNQVEKQTQWTYQMYPGGGGSVRSLGDTSVAGPSDKFDFAAYVTKILRSAVDLKFIPDLKQKVLDS